MKRQADQSDLEGEVRHVCRQHSVPKAVTEDLVRELQSLQSVLKNVRTEIVRQRGMRDTATTPKARRLIAKAQREHDTLLRLLERQRPLIESQLASHPENLLAYRDAAEGFTQTARHLETRAFVVELMRVRRGQQTDMGRHIVLLKLATWLRCHGIRPTSTGDGIFARGASFLLGHDSIKHTDLMSAMHSSLRAASARPSPTDQEQRE